MRAALQSCLFSVLFGLGLCHAEEEYGDTDKTFPEWATCVAYTIRDADERDAQFPDADSVDPFGSEDLIIPRGSILRHEHVLDAAALTTRLVAAERIGKAAAVRVISAVTHGDEKHPLKDCYEPHHLFVYYNRTGRAVACFEVCLTCNRVKMAPKLMDTLSPDGAFETADLLMIARVLSEASLPLTPYTSFEEYEKRIEGLRKTNKKQNKSE